MERAKLGKTAESGDRAYGVIQQAQTAKICKSGKSAQIGDPVSVKVEGLQLRKVLEGTDVAYGVAAEDKGLESGKMLKSRQVADARAGYGDAGGIGGELGGAKLHCVIKLGVAYLAAGESLFEFVHLVGGDGGVAFQREFGEPGEFYENIQIAVLKTGVFETETAEHRESAEDLDAAEGVAAEPEGFEVYKILGGGYILHLVSVKVQMLKSHKGHKGADVLNLVVPEAEPFQLLQIDEGAQVADGVVAQIQLHKLGALGKGAQVGDALTAEVKLGDIAFEGDAAHSYLLDFLGNIIGVDLAVGECLLQLLQLCIRDVYALHTEGTERLEAVKRGEIIDRVVVDVKGLQIAQRGEGTEIGDLVVGKLQEVDGVHTLKEAQVGDGVSGKTEAFQFLKQGYAAHIGVGETLFGEKQALYGELDVSAGYFDGFTAVAFTLVIAAAVKLFKALFYGAAADAGIAEREYLYCHIRIAGGVVGVCHKQVAFLGLVNVHSFFQKLYAFLVVALKEGVLRAGIELFVAAAAAAESYADYYNNYQHRCRCRAADEHHFLFLFKLA